VPDNIDALWADLQNRWPENILEPSLTRIASVVELLGDPQRAVPIIHITGTNGKTSTARMTESLLRAAGLRTGLFTSPHLMSPAERIQIDGEPIDDDRVLALWADIRPYVEIVDARSIADGGPALSFFEVMTALAYAAFADAPVDVAVIEVGMGGEWDATSVAHATVAVIAPIDLDHTEYLGDSVRDIAVEKAGIIKPDCRAVIARQDQVVQEILAGRCVAVNAVPSWEGAEFEVVERAQAVGGQLIALRVDTQVFTDIFLPLFGAHQAHNAALALAAVHAFLGPVPADVVEEGFAAVTSPGRLQVMRRNPTVVVDTAHNPHGIAAVLAAVGESMGFDPLIVVFGALEDKDVVGMLRLIGEAAQSVILWRPQSPRAMALDQLTELAIAELGSERVWVADSPADAIDRAVTLAEAEQAYGGGGVLITGSVVLVADALRLLGGAR
jgi:dihydrofolate synthase / folylpolyglutamate synthase